ncbi:uncharacterized protein EI90DRAFT_3055591 [Cantharellus anzutake]|uniref:uncharacterized protein n=1 Tax=Cantharellus anzutake TaxID=1750568 RepID=UPI001904C5D9|nr:uncharacterized protein EI90DRAFT_3104240 [Cantharellus anzutake]XP_038908480.1 uncharacterized protein EI90DRAFT_3091134 [Cantharellus anzutake]XP_038910786.1 uncharacterized protein EI90DRAFT_3078370 [Cantharellus anzutake]XP_038916865.1 uncharacterized protein EI90DRAFT_3055591 [Cantharellus anzutake]KAF8309707.1 hypothetical protein EI90DRAFT_3104240 [Cantharellus anzutake]KAF8313971.1 hypothetical protein EI90DRAFT_3091134 [Cantharellus anzutake]KAF8321981.1 hypothetical protein EI90D
MLPGSQDAQTSFHQASMPAMLQNQQSYFPVGLHSQPNVQLSFSGATLGNLSETPAPFLPTGPGDPDDPNLAFSTVDPGWSFIPFQDVPDLWE